MLGFVGAHAGSLINALRHCWCWLKYAVPKDTQWRESCHKWGSHFDDGAALVRDRCKSSIPGDSNGCPTCHSEP